MMSRPKASQLGNRLLPPSPIQIEQRSITIMVPDPAGLLAGLLAADECVPISLGGSGPDMDEDGRPLSRVPSTHYSSSVYSAHTSEANSPSFTVPGHWLTRTSDSTESAGGLDDGMSAPTKFAEVSAAPPAGHGPLPSPVAVTRNIQMPIWEVLSTISTTASSSDKEVAP